MVCRVTDMCSKEVICIKDGTRLGFVCDVDIDILSGKAEAIIIFGKPKFFGLFGRENDLYIRWDDITVIGDDTVLVDFDPPDRRKIKSLFSQDFWTNSDKQQ